MDTLLTSRGALLGALMHGKGYGLELIERVKAYTNGTVLLSHATIYPELRTMEREGLLKSWEADPTPERGGRPRRYYELTAVGRRRAAEAGRAVNSLFPMVPAWTT